MQALDTLARPAHTTLRARPTPIGRDQCIAFFRVTGVSLAQQLGVDVALGLPDAAVRLQAADERPYIRIHQPVPSGHGLPVAQVRRVCDDRGSAPFATYHDDKLPVGHPAQQTRDRREIRGEGSGGRFAVRGQCQNSSEETMRPSRLLDAALRPAFTLPPDEFTSAAACCVVVVSDPGGSSDAEDGATGAASAGSPA